MKWPRRAPQPDPLAVLARAVEALTEQGGHVTVDACQTRDSAARTEAAVCAVLDAVSKLSEALAPVLALAEQVATLTDQIGRLETAVRQTDGRAERIELYLVGKDRAYPTTQLDLGAGELARRRQRIDAAATGETP